MTNEILGLLAVGAMGALLVVAILGGVWVVRALRADGSEWEGY